MPVCKGLFYNESIAAVVLERVTQRSRLGCPLSCMIIASCLDDFPQFSVCEAKSRMCFLYVHCGKFLTKIGFSDAKIYVMSVLNVVCNRATSLLLDFTTLSTFCSVSIVPR